MFSGLARSRSRIGRRPPATNCCRSGARLLRHIGRYFRSFSVAGCGRATRPRRSTRTGSLEWMAVGPEELEWGTTNRSNMRMTTHGGGMKDRRRPRQKPGQLRSRAKSPGNGRHGCLHRLASLSSVRLPDEVEPARPVPSEARVVPQGIPAAASCDRRSHREDRAPRRISLRSALVSRPPAAGRAIERLLQDLYIAEVFLASPPAEMPAIISGLPSRPAPPRASRRGQRGRCAFSGFIA